MLDSDLAVLYGASTKVLLQAMKRNKGRFPEDFMFRLTSSEARDLKGLTPVIYQINEEYHKDTILRSQIVTLKNGHGKHRKYLPYVFTEQGVAMLSSVLKSGRAVSVNIEIMRAFVRLRKIVSEHKTLILRLDDLEMEYDEKFKVIFQAIHKLMELPKVQKKRRIGFRANKASCKEKITPPL